MPKWKPPPLVLFDTPCLGRLSLSTPTDCDKSITVPMPFTHEFLIKHLRKAGWFVTSISPPGESPPRVGILCGDCARALIPELVDATLKVWDDKVLEGKDRES